MIINTHALIGRRDGKLLPTTEAPPTVTLRGACGLGHGRGQLLARIHMTDRNRPIVVERMFMPRTLGHKFTTQPFAFQTRPFHPDPNVLRDWTYVIAEISVSVASTPVMQMEYLDGTPLHAGWHNLNLDAFKLDEEWALQLMILTSLAYKNRSPRWRPKHPRNFDDADSIQFRNNVWRPEPKAERPRPHTSRKETTPPVVSAAAAPVAAVEERKVTTNAAEDNGFGAIAFLARHMRDVKVETLVDIRDPEEIAAAAVASAVADATIRAFPKAVVPHHQHKNSGDRPRHNHKPQGSRPKAVLNKQLAAGLANFKLQWPSSP